ncbi:hypothetical protein ACJ72_04751 [Emergomyces africanus]|uniref:4-hydroxy-2-oxoglutarate aldolase, mitochondrial n=1 Tax=Emergomyces africanus TaxID=1955775 RepID=A0A1B7NVW2_9EURO|nr:hypothetical protein ACJ72_04751 [Emergomyces africanus]
MVAKIPKSGVWCPAVTFFDPATDTLDLISQKKYYTYLSQSGLAGLVILGTNAEAFLLTREERAQLIAAAREAVGPEFPLMAGVGAHSTRQVLEHIRDAADAGANYVLVLPPAYFGKATTPSVIKSFFKDIAAHSSLPVVIYNFPGVCNGVDLDSEIITAIAKQSENIVGVKLTCASSDFLIGGLSVGSAGCIAAFANVFPKTISRIYDLYKRGEVEEAMRLHRIAALAESPCKSGIASTKYAAAIFSAKRAGIEGAEEKLKPRRPYEPASEAAKENVRTAMAELAAIEEGL